MACAAAPKRQRRAGAQRWLGSPHLFDHFIDLGQLHLCALLHWRFVRGARAGQRPAVGFQSRALRTMPWQPEGVACSVERGAAHSAAGGRAAAQSVALWPRQTLFMAKRNSSAEMKPSPSRSNTWQRGGRQPREPRQPRQCPPASNATQRTQPGLRRTSETGVRTSNAAMTALATSAFMSGFSCILGVISSCQ